MTSYGQLCDVIFQIFMGMLFSVTRLMGFFKGSPILSQQIVTGYLRTAFALSLVFILYPIVQVGHPPGEVPLLWTAGILIKEFLLGFLLGYAVGLIFWVGHGVGFLIDNQRGAAIASTFVALLEDQGSPLASMVMMTMLTLMFVSGAFLTVLSFLFETYRLWPVFSFFPALSKQDLPLLINRFDHFVYMTALLASPVLIATFLTEFGLGIVNRFAPQLNVFFLSMPIKSAVAVVILIVYATFLMQFFKEQFKSADVMIDIFTPFLK